MSDMLKTVLKKGANGPIGNRWSVYFQDPSNKEDEGDFVGNIYRSQALNSLGYDGYEFFYCPNNTEEVIQQYYRNQYELMRFLHHVGKGLREAKR